MTLPGNGKATSLLRQHLLLLSAWRYARQHYWQTWLSFIGIVLGVMMVVAVDLANSSARRAFDLSIETISGSLTHQISGGSDGVPEQVFTRLRTELGLQRSAPSITAQVRVQDRNFTLLGVDLFSEMALARQRPGFSPSPQQSLGGALQSLLQPRAVAMQQGTADELGLQLDQTFTINTTGGSQELQLAAMLPAALGSELVLFADIATAQDVTGRVGKLDSIDLVLSAAEATRVRQWLPPALTLIDAGNRNASLQQMTAAFHTNLLAMSLLALLVAALLIYNTVSLSVVQRQETLGVLRSLGVTGRELIKLIVLEVSVLAVAASLVGLVFGLGLGQLLVKLVTRTVDDLYFNLTVTRFLFDPVVLAKGFAWGTGVSLLAAALPAWQAGQSRPITLQQHGSDEDSHPQRARWLALVGAVMVSTGYALLLPERGSLLLAFIALNCVVFGCCLTVPLFMQGVLGFLLRIFQKQLRAPLRLALRNLQHSLSRTALAVAALTVAVSVTVGVGVMTGSFRDTVILWLEQSLRGDVMVGRPDGGAIDAALAAELGNDARIATLETQYRQQAESSAGAITVIAETSRLEQHLFIKTADADALAQANAGDAVLISEPLAWQANLKIGDTLTVHASNGEVALPIAGVFYDYTTGAGLVAVSQQRFTQWWPQTAPSRLILQAAASADKAALTSELRQRLTRIAGSYNVAANADIRAITLTIFDRTFAITHVLRLLAILVAFVGVLSALLTLQLQRLREYAMLRATGMSIRETGVIMLAQTVTMGLLAGVLAIPLGLMMADILIDVINKRSFGWSMLHTLSWPVLVQAVLLALVAAVLAGVYPMRRVASVHPAAGMQKL